MTVVRRQLLVRQYITTVEGKIIPKLNGRPPGVKNKVSVLKNIEKHKNNGIMPVDFLLKVMRGKPIKQGKDTQGNQKYWNPSEEQRIRCAIAAAPYVSPRLSTVEVIKNTNDDQLLEIIKNAASAAGISIDLEKLMGDDGTVTYALPVEDEEDE